MSRTPLVHSTDVQAFKIGLDFKPLLRDQFPRKAQGLHNVAVQQFLTANGLLSKRASTKLAL